jgi:hypothetical protein
MTERCADEYNVSTRCQGTDGHSGPHWANTNRQAGPRWGLSDYGCLVGIEVGLVCRNGPNHAGLHGDGKGSTWTDEEPAGGKVTDE